MAHHDESSALCPGITLKLVFGLSLIVFGASLPILIYVFLLATKQLPMPRTFCEESKPSSIETPYSSGCTPILSLTPDAGPSGPKLRCLYRDPTIIPNLQLNPSESAAQLSRGTIS